MANSLGPDVLQSNDSSRARAASVAVEGHVIETYRLLDGSPTRSFICQDRRIVTDTLSTNTFALDAMEDIEAFGRQFRPILGMNGQFVRSAVVISLIRALTIDAFVETGTFRGETCLLLAAQTECRIYSCDIDPPRHAFARKLLKPFGSRVRLALRESVSFLRELIMQERLKLPLFYLDAHWYDPCPIRAELSTIINTLDTFLIIIDDFQVPSDDGFGFDRYGEVVLNMELIADILQGSATELVAMYPAYPSVLETGARRGFVMIVAKAVLPNLSSLSMIHYLRLQV